VQRTEKEELVTSLNRAFQEAVAVVVTRQSGLTVAEMTELRRKMRQVGGGFKVAKNRLARRALSGTKYEGLADLLTGPTAIAFSSDPVAVAKVAVDFSKTNEKLTIAGGALGAQLLDSAGVKALATLPSLNELRGKIAGLLNAPATKIASVLQAPAGQLARVVQAYASKGEAAKGEAA
jgi:large subunit ribosomal protein L10